MLGGGVDRDVTHGHLRLLVPLRLGRLDFTQLLTDTFAVLGLDLLMPAYPLASASPVSASFGSCAVSAFPKNGNSPDHHPQSFGVQLTMLIFYVF